MEDGRGKVLLVGFPDVGLVGEIAVAYLIEKLELDEVGYVDSEMLPPVVAIHNTRVRELIRIYRGRNVVAILSEMPVPRGIIPSLSKAIVEWVGKKGLKEIICLTGLAEANRLDIETPKVYAVAGSEQQLKSLMERTGAEALTDGYIAGVNAELLRQAIRSKVNVGVLLAQSHFNYPDPGSAAQTILSLSKIIGEVVDVQQLLESAESIRLQMRDLMRRTEGEMASMEKSRELELPAVYR